MNDKVFAVAFVTPGEPVLVIIGVFTTDFHVKQAITEVQLNRQMT